MPGIRAVDVAGCSIIQRAACLLNHLVVHDLVIGRVCTHLEFVDLPMVAAAPHPGLLGSLEERHLRLVVWLGALMHS